MKDEKPEKSEGGDRQDRLAAALRANLRRRKDQQRGRQAEPPPADPAADGDRDT